MSKSILSRLTLVASLVLIFGFAATAQQSPAETKPQSEQKPRPAPEKQDPPATQERKQPRPAEEQPKDQGPSVKVSTEVVTLTVTVTDPYNRLVTGLDKQNFEVFEDKVKQTIEYFRATL